MKYYGFKFESFKAEISKINPNVSTWIGTVGTFMLILTAVGSGGFKGHISPYGIITILYPAILWFICHLGVDKSWPKTALIFISAVAASIAFLIMVMRLIAQKGVDFIFVVFLLFFIFNAGIYLILKMNNYYLSEQD